MVPSVTILNRRGLLTAVLGAFAVMMLAACRPIQPPAAAQPASAPAIPELAIEVGDSGFVVPDPAPGGIVSVAVRNTGAQPHTASLWRIRDGHTQDEIVAMNDLLQENPDAFFGIFELGSWIHYSEEIAPGATQQFYADLGKGEFFLIDDANPGQAPAFFTAPEIVGTVEPAADVQVDMADFSYAMPARIPAGQKLWEVTNSGAQWHLAAIITANPDATPEEILASFGGPDTPPPADAAVQVMGGMPPMSPGERVWLAIELAPGKYEVVCPLPDLAALATGGEPLPHLLHGMRHAFTVEE
jgi:hypothetical protein